MSDDGLRAFSTRARAAEDGASKAGLLAALRPVAEPCGSPSAGRSIRRAAKSRDAGCTGIC